MIINANEAENHAVLSVAQQMMAAARTAPKTKGQDFLHTCIVTGDDLEALASSMEAIGEQHNLAFCIRDAKNIRNSQAVVLLGIGHNPRGLNEACQFCGSSDCAVSQASGNCCVYDPIDLGIAIGSAVSVAADHRIDNRVMFSVGVGALSLNLFDPSVKIAVGIPLSTHGKSIYYDRK